MRAVKKKKKSIFLRIALLAFSVYVIVMLIQLQLQINEIAAYVRMNEDLQNKSDNYEKYQEQQARKQGLTRPEELILVEVPGD